VLVVLCCNQIVTDFGIRLEGEGLYRQAVAGAASDSAVVWVILKKSGDAFCYEEEDDCLHCDCLRVVARFP